MSFAQSNVDGFVLGTVSSGSTPVEQVSVTIVKVDTGVSKSVATINRGTFRFVKTPTGTYEVVVDADGYDKATQRITVAVGRGTPVNFDLRSDSIEEVVVTASSSSLIDTSKAETTMVPTMADIEELPVPRDINAVALIAPGAVLGDSSFGGSGAGGRQHYSTGFGLVSFGGSSVAENVYYINGMNVTNFRNGLAGSTVPFEFYDQFQLKTGGVLNAVTRRGTNDWRVRMGYMVEPESLGGHSPNVPDPNNTGEYDAVFSLDTKAAHEAYLSVGGPAIRDKLFVYGIYETRLTDTENFTGSGRLFREVDDDPFLGAKMDWSIHPDHRIELTAFADESTRVRDSFEWDETTDEVGDKVGSTYFERGGENYIGRYTGIFGDDASLSLLVGKSRYDLTNRALSDDTCPLARDSCDGGDLTPIGCWVNSLPETEHDERLVYRADFEYVINHRHVLRVGLEHETNTSTNVGRYSGPRGDYYR